MLVVILVLREPLPASDSLAKSSWLHWTGGLFGAVYVVITILLLPRLGPPPCWPCSSPAR